MSIRRTVLAFSAALAGSILFSSAGIAADDEFTITIKDHRFSPASLTVPANKPFKLIVVNEDPTPEEFESHDFHVEKIIPGGQKATFRIAPLEPGSYKFFGEFHEDTALGNLFVE